MPSETRRGFAESFAIPVGIVVLIAWGVATFAFEAPGWVHLFLTLGAFVLLWGIVARGTPPLPPPRDSAPGRTPPAGGNAEPRARR